jgi:hypothetical protein
MECAGCVKNQMRKNDGKNLSGKATACLDCHHHFYTRDRALRSPPVCQLAAIDRAGDHSLTSGRGIAIRDHVSGSR